MPKYLALTDKDFLFEEEEVNNFDYLVKQGHDLSDIAKYMKRPYIEILLLYLDRLDKNKIKPIYGIRRLWSGVS